MFLFRDPNKDLKKQNLLHLKEKYPSVNLNSDPLILLSFQLNGNIYSLRAFLSSEFPAVPPSNYIFFYACNVINIYLF